MNELTYVCTWNSIRIYSTEKSISIQTEKVGDGHIIVIQRLLLDILNKKQIECMLWTQLAYIYFQRKAIYTTNIKYKADSIAVLATSLNTFISALEILRQYTKYTNYIDDRINSIVNNPKKTDISHIKILTSLNSER